MRLGDGTELLEPNDPLGAAIGVIYVAPTDDRQSVLSAIYAQDSLKRKQIAIVLPEQNKAFKHPVDFEGLKGMRNKLQTKKLVFVAPPGPAEFARHRGFEVYSSIERYTQSLRDEEQKEEKQAAKRGWFGFGKPSPNSSPANSSKAQPLPPVMVVPVPTEHTSNGMNSAVNEQHTPLTTTPGVAPGSNGTAPDAADAPGDDAFVPVGDDEADHVIFAPPGPAPATVDSTPPGSSPALEDIDTQPVTPTGTNAAGPGVIAFPRRGNSGKIPAVGPVPGAQPEPQPANSPIKQRSSGKIAAVGAGAAGLALGATAARGATVGGGGGTPPPVRGPSGKRGGPGGSPRGGTRRRWLIAALLVLLTLLFIGWAIAAAGPGMFRPLANIIPGGSPSATVTITPSSKDLNNTYIISAVTGTPDPTQRQVQARQLSPSATSQPKTVKATGVGHIPPAQATGTLTFFNGSTADFTVAVGTVLSGRSGVEVVTDAPAVIPAANPPTEGSTTVSAHAAQAGSRGNITAFDINETCCVTGNFITVQNQPAFHGGQDQQDYTIVQQSDIDGAANSLEKPLTDSVQADLQKQMRAGEKLVSPAQCTKKVTADHAAGDRAANVTVSVTVTCTAEVYDEQGALTMAKNLLIDKAKTDPGAAYALVGDIVTRVTKIMVTDPKQATLNLYVNAEGIWVYQFNDARKQELAKQIAGKSKQAAIDFLKTQPGIAKVDDIQLPSGDTLPTDPQQITIIVQNVPGLKGTPPGGPGTPPTTPQGTPMPTPTSQNGLGRN